MHTGPADSAVLAYRELARDALALGLQRHTALREYTQLLECSQFGRTRSQLGAHMRAGATVN